VTSYLESENSRYQYERDQLKKKEAILATSMNLDALYKQGLTVYWFETRVPGQKPAKEERKKIDVEKEIVIYLGRPKDKQ